MQMNRCVASLLVLFTIVACEQPSEKKLKVLIEAAPETGDFSSTRLARLDSGMDNWVKKKWINGAVALIACKGKIVFHKAYGYNDLDTKSPLDKNGIFRIASQRRMLGPDIPAMNPCDIAAPE